MAIDKPTKPTNLMPRTFGGEKNNFSDDLIASGFEPNTPRTYNGDNLNYQLDATGKELDYCEKVVDYINGLGVGKTPIVNANNKLDETQVGLKVYSATETYSLGEWVRSGDKIYQSLTQGNLGKDLTNETYWKEVRLGGGSGLEVCDIGMALYVDETKGLRRYLNGQIVDINTNTQAFLNRLQQITTLHPSLLCTEEEWQSAKTSSAFGQVGKFVFNYSGEEIVSVRLPRVVNVQGLFDLQNLGMTVSESLPNIKGIVGQTGYDRTPSGAFYSTTRYGTYATGNFSFHDTNFDASRSSSTYQDGAPVQPEAIQYPYFIQIATGSETENNIINEIELNNPYSLFECKYSDYELFNLSWLVSNGSYNGSNAVYPSAYQALLVENNAEITIGSTVTLPNGTEYTKQGLSVKLSTETYTDYDFVINSANETFRPPIKPRNLNNTRYLIEKGEQDGVNYRIYCDGYCEQWGTTGTIATGSATQVVSFLKEYPNTNYSLTFGTFGNSFDSPEADFRCTGYTSSSVTFYNNSGTPTVYKWQVCGYLAEGEYTPLTDNILLYYYVGETVQNANLIDAGRIGEQLANKQDKCIHIIDTYVNGTSGYRVWSDGYCEQWGRTSSDVSAPQAVSFLKEFKDTNYNSFAGVGGVGSPNDNSFIVTTLGKTTTGMNINNYNSGSGHDNYYEWKACGYLASGQY